MEVYGGRSKWKRAATEVRLKNPPFVTRAALFCGNKKSRAPKTNFY